MRPSQSTFLAWVSIVLGLFILGQSSNVEAASLTTLVSVRSVSGGTGPCDSTDFDQATAGTSISVDGCGTISPNGPFNSDTAGSARASFGSLGVDISTGISIGSTTLLGLPLGVYFAEGSARATSLDRITIDSGPSSGFLAIGFDLDGTLNFFEEGPQSARGSFASIFLDVSSSINGPYFEHIGRTGPPQSGELTFLLPYDGGFADLEITLLGQSACGRFDGIGAPTAFKCMTSANYFTSATVIGLDVLDSNKNPVANAQVTSESGFDYQAGVSEPPVSNPIPEPGTVLLLGTGLVGLIAWRYTAR